MDQLNIDQNLNFGQAIQALKEGKQIARKGWNGKNMFVCLNKGAMPFDNQHGDDNLLAGNFTEGIKNELFESHDTGTIVRLPNLNMRSATGSTVTGWLASQTDILAEDWNVIN